LNGNLRLTTISQRLHFGHSLVGIHSCVFEHVQIVKFFNGQCSSSNHVQKHSHSVHYSTSCRGVDNGAANNLACRRFTEMMGFSASHTILPCTLSKRLHRSARTSARSTLAEENKISIYLTMSALMISVFIAAIITRLAWCWFDPCCSSIVIGKNLFCFVTGKLYWIHCCCDEYVVI